MVSLWTLRLSLDHFSESHGSPSLIWMARLLHLFHMCLLIMGTTRLSWCCEFEFMPAAVDITADRLHIREANITSPPSRNRDHTF